MNKNAINISNMQQDVRRPKNIHPYPERKQVEAEEGDNGSLYQIASLVLGVMSFIFKVNKIIMIDKMGLLDMSAYAIGFLCEYAFSY